MNETGSAVRLSVAALSVDCTDPAALAEFWGKVLGRPVTPGPSPENVVVEATEPTSGPRLFFNAVPEPKVGKNRLHLDLVTEHYEEETRRLIGLGATPVNEIKFPGARWTTFADPEGNEFDLLTFQS